MHLQLLESNECCAVLLGQQLGCGCLACHVDMEDKYSVWYVALALCNYVSCISHVPHKLLIVL